MDDKKKWWGVLFFIWMLLILAVFYVVQKPLFFQYGSGFALTIGSLGLSALLILNATSVGCLFLAWIQDSHARILLGSALGLGLLGLLGFLLAAIGLAHPIVLSVVQGVIFLFLLMKKKLILGEIVEFYRMIADSASRAPKGVLFFVVAMTIFSFHIGEMME